MDKHNYGQCGLGNVAMLEKPHLVSFFSDKNVTHIAAGGFHSLAVSNDFVMYGWGCGEKGQTGLGDYNDTPHPKKCVSYLRPKQVSFQEKKQLNISVEPEDRIIQVRAGGHHSLILLESGAIYGFGYAALGQLGYGGIKNQTSPCLVKSFV